MIISIAILKKSDACEDHQEFFLKVFGKQKVVINKININKYIKAVRNETFPNMRKRNGFIGNAFYYLLQYLKKDDLSYEYNKRWLWENISIDRQVKYFMKHCYPYIK
jgi:hypothetical protein